MSRATRIAFSVFFALSLLFSVLISALRVMALKDFELESEYFAYGSQLPTVVNYLLFASVLIFFVCGLYLRGKIYLAPSDRGVPFYFGNAVLGTSLAAYSLFSLPLFFEAGQASVFSTPLSGALLLLSTCFAIAGVFFTVHNCLFPNAEKSLRLIFGLSIPLFAIMKVLHLYFDTTSPLNAPNKILDQFTYVLIALYLLYELRTLMKAPRYAAQCTLGFITMIFTAVNAFPSFIYMTTHGSQLSANAAHDILMIAFFLYVTIRMGHVLFSESARNDRVLELLTEAEHPADALKEREENTADEENDTAAQITFDTVDSPEIEIIPDEMLFDANPDSAEKDSLTAQAEDIAPTEENENQTDKSAENGENA